MLYRISLFAAPLLYATSGFYWINGGQYSVTCGTLIVIGSFFWVYALIGLFDLLKEQTPRYATLGRAVATYGCVCGGVAFGLQGMFSEMFNISHKAMLQGMAHFPIASNLVFWLAGPVFPLSILILGIVLSIKRVVPFWIGILLSAGGLLFPLSRIFRIELVAHLVDLLMLVPTWYIALNVIAIRGRKINPSNN